MIARDYKSDGNERSPVLTIKASLGVCVMDTARSKMAGYGCREVGSFDKAISETSGTRIRSRNEVK